MVIGTLSKWNLKLSLQWYKVVSNNLWSNHASITIVLIWNRPTLITNCFTGQNEGWSLALWASDVWLDPMGGRACVIWELSQLDIDKSTSDTLGTRPACSLAVNFLSHLKIWKNSLVKLGILQRRLPFHEFFRNFKLVDILEWITFYKSCVFL